MRLLKIIITLGQTINAEKDKILNSFANIDLAQRLNQKIYETQLNKNDIKQTTNTALWKVEGIWSQIFLSAI